MSDDSFSDVFTLVAVAVFVTLLFSVALAVLVHPATLALGAVAAATLAVVRHRQNRADALARAKARENYEEKRLHEDRAQLLCDIDLFFPYVRKSFEELTAEGSDPEDAFWQALALAPATELGTTFHGLPALLPLSERPKHLYVVGKTGSGKTSLLFHLIQDDLAEGRGIAVIAPEAELFRDWLLPSIPEERRREVIYFAPGHRHNPLTWNPLAIEPGDDSKRAAGEFFTVFKRAFGEEDLGARAGPILGNAFACLTGRPGVTLWDLKRILHDQRFRDRVLADTEDPYVREFWLSTYPTYPKGSHLPILNRLDQFLRPPAIRRAFCHPTSSFSIRETLEDSKILLLDLSHLDPQSMMLLGQLLLASFQLELMRRERLPEEERTPYHLYADEFQTFAGVAEGTWRELLSRGRGYGLALTLAHQHPSQLPIELREEILGNVASIVSFGLSAKDAWAMRREFIEENPADLSMRTLAQETLVGLKVGSAVARLGSGALAIPLAALAPHPRPTAGAGRLTRNLSWTTYGVPDSARVPYEPTLPKEETTSDKRTRRAPPLCTGDGLRLGMNPHGGKDVAVALSDKQRTQHMYVIGASGTGKSTFLLNCVVQGMERGDGFAVLDPHGDLVDQILALVPDHRRDDVVLVDPADREYPIGFNILRAHSELEKELLASDLVSVFRRLSTRWGDQMNSVLANAILAFLESTYGGTLLDMRKFLVEAEYRSAFLSTVADEEVRYYWEKEFPLLPGKPQAPLLTRLDTFLRPKLIRNMVSQRESALDFGRIMDTGGIFLGKLSQGAIGEGNAYLLGSMMVSKFYQMALSRQAIEHEDRRPFYLYIDECHNFLTPSMASILSGARKYGLGLVLAHQELQQVSGRDSDVLSAVISNPYTRVCFRVGDLDAKKLEKGFGHFDAKDLQSLGVGEAICRVERADFDFNLKTAPMPTIDPREARSKTESLVARSRERYATPRSKLAPRTHPAPAQTPPPVPARETPAVAGREEPPAIPLTVPTTVPEVPPRPAVKLPIEESLGRGGQRHKYLQALVKRWGESHGYRAMIEKRILDGAGSVDIALERAEHSIAVEISITTTPAAELKHIRTCLDAGFDHVVAVTENTRSLSRMQALIDKEFDDDERARIESVAPESLFATLGALATSSDGEPTSVRGYKVKVEYQATEEGDARHRQRAISSVVASTLKRMKGPK